MESKLLVNEGAKERKTDYGSVENSKSDEIVSKTSVKHQVVINVVMFLYFAAFSPILVVTQQYIYSQLKEKNAFPDVAGNDNESKCHLNTTQREAQDVLQSESSFWMIGIKVRFSRCLDAHSQKLSNVQNFEPNLGDK